jgi:hypothetical protein
MIESCGSLSACQPGDRRAPAAWRNERPNEILGVNWCSECYLDTLTDSPIRTHAIMLLFMVQSVGNDEGNALGTRETPPNL